MVVRQFPLVQTRRVGEVRANGRRGTAYVNPRDAYRGVPILAQPTWRHEIAAYFYLGGISSGAFVLGSLARLAGGERRLQMSHTAQYVSCAAMLPCAPLLIADLGRPALFHHMLRIFKPSSPMNLGAWTLTAHRAMSTITAARALAGEARLPLGVCNTLLGVCNTPLLGSLVRRMPERPLAVAGLPSALTLGGYTGVLLGTTSVPVWATSPLLGALFMASSLSTGAAATSLAAPVSGRSTPGEEAALRRLSLVLGAGEMATLGGYVATSDSAAKPLLTGKNRLLMIGAAASLVASTALEVAGLLTGSKRFSHAAAAATLVGGALLRWGVVQAGHASARDRDGQLEAMKPTSRAPGWGPSRRREAEERALSVSRVM
jgi:formate-dependent nitrite reductase membrane component NrfD